MKVLGVIPARGGSKGVPGKNIKCLGGKPLLQWTAEAARASRLLTRVVLSTDSEEIAAVGRECGLEVPFIRPSSLSLDTTPTLPVLQHAVRVLETRSDPFDAVCLLQPTSPFRNESDIDSCIALMESAQADSVVSVLAVPYEYNPHWVYFREDSGMLRLSTGAIEPIPRRQDLPPAYHREGSVYVTRRDELMERNSLFGRRVIGYIVDRAENVNIDTASDWVRAERFLSTGFRSPSTSTELVTCR